MLTTLGVFSWNSLTDRSSAASSSLASPAGACIPTHMRVATWMDLQDDCTRPESADAERQRIGQSHQYQPIPTFISNVACLAPPNPPNIGSARAAVGVLKTVATTMATLASIVARPCRHCDAPPACGQQQHGCPHSLRTAAPYACTVWQGLNAHTRLVCRRC